MNTRNSSPLVSVIMPAYNAEAFIKEAIDSVTSQTLTDLELIVIDDASTDGTLNVASNLAMTDSRITVLHNEHNIGVARTRNRGLDTARGAYVAFLDSDDVWKPVLLDRMVYKIKQASADIVYCSYSIIDENGNKLCNDFIVPSKTDFEASIVRSVITCSTSLITQKLAKENRFPDNMYHEDIAMWFKILKSGKVAVGITDVLAAYRQRSGSRSANKLSSALRRWTIYRSHLNMTVCKSAITMVRYAFYGVKKFRRI